MKPPYKKLFHLIVPLLPGSGYFFAEKIAQHILIRRAGGTMFRHHNNHHIIIY